MPFQASSIIDEHLGPSLHWRVHMVFSTRKSYFAHQSSSLEQHRFPRIPVNCSLSSYRGTSFLQWSQLLDFFQPTACACSQHTAVDFHLAHQSTLGCFPTTAVQPVLCYKWNECSRPQIIWVSMAQVIIRKHCTTCCLPGINCSLLRWKMHWHSCGCGREWEVRVETSQRSWRRRRRTKSGRELSHQGRCGPSASHQSLLSTRVG